MHIPHEEIIAPGPVAESVASLRATDTTAILFGRAKDLRDLPRHTQVRKLWISGVNEAAARVMGEMKGLRSLVIHDLRIADLQAFASLEHLEDLAIAGSSRVKSLAGLESLTRLESLILFDCCNYGNVRALAPLTGLETLCLEGGFSKALALDTLEPLASLTRLRRLRLASIRVADRSLRPIHALREVREVFIAKMFPPAELRSLAAALPNARGEYLDSFRSVD